jgi:hypothetical protein
MSLRNSKQANPKPARPTKPGFFVPLCRPLVPPLSVPLRPAIPRQQNAPALAGARPSSWRGELADSPADIFLAKVFVCFRG